ncbi:MAG: hypothetical protein LBM77_04005 [Spirochaetaceae bacterium]|jgi:hypothetical protein|nr:hypothetical protein [Spirochaetaceae bacterium]
MYAVKGFYQGDRHVVLPEWPDAPISGNYEVIITFLDPLFSESSLDMELKTNVKPQKPDIHYPEPDLEKRKQAFIDFSRFAGTLHSDFDPDKMRMNALEEKYGPFN